MNHSKTPEDKVYLNSKSVLFSVLFDKVSPSPSGNKSKQKENKDEDNDSASVQPCDQLKRKWMVTASNCDYNELVQLLKEDCYLAGVKVVHVESFIKTSY